MMREKINTIFLMALIYLAVGIESTFSVGYHIIHYFPSKNQWYIADLSIVFLDAIGLFVALVVLLKKISDRILIVFYRVFIALGGIGVLSLMILRFYYHIAIPDFPPKLIIVTLIIDGFIIKIILDKKIKPLF
jgi:hypothetical protein